MNDNFITSLRQNFFSKDIELLHYVLWDTNCELLHHGTDVTCISAISWGLIAHQKPLKPYYTEEEEKEHPLSPWNTKIPLISLFHNDNSASIEAMSLHQCITFIQGLVHLIHCSLNVEKLNYIDEIFEYFQRAQYRLFLLTRRYEFSTIEEYDMYDVPEYMHDHKITPEFYITMDSYCSYMMKTMYKRYIHSYYEQYHCNTDTLEEDIEQYIDSVTEKFFVDKALESFYLLMTPKQIYRRLFSFQFPRYNISIIKDSQIHNAYIENTYSKLPNTKSEFFTSKWIHVKQFTSFKLYCTSKINKNAMQTLNPHISLFESHRTPNYYFDPCDLLWIVNFKDKSYRTETIYEAYLLVCKYHPEYIFK